MIETSRNLSACPCVLHYSLLTPVPLLQSASRPSTLVITSLALIFSTRWLHHTGAVVGWGRGK